MGIPAEGPVGTEVDDGPFGIAGDAGGGRVTGSTGLTGLDVKSFAGRLGAAPQSGRVWRSWPKEPRPPLPTYPPREGVNWERGPAGGTIGPVSARLRADIDIGALFVGIVGDGEGAVIFLVPPGPVGGLNVAGPLGGDLGRTGDLSLGVDLAALRSRYASWAGGDRSRVKGGVRGRDACCTAVNRLG